jgi:hypothetical protein
MARTIEIIDNNVIIKDGNKITAIPVDENNSGYQQIKTETNNFTENMIEKNQLEILEQAQTDLIFQLMTNEVI